MSSNGKGDDRRPAQVSREEFDRRWERIFGGGPAPSPVRDTVRFEGGPLDGVVMSREELIRRMGQD